MANTENAVAEVKNSLPVAAEFLEELANDSGLGFENVTSADLAIPYYTVLQAMSPQVKRGPRQIVGAKEGDIYNTVTQEIISGDDGIVVIPCVFQKLYVEWTPRESGGGLVEQHASEAILAKTTRDPKGNYVLPNGNHVVQTSYHYVMRVKEDGTLERALISMTSTQLKMSRRWMALQMALQMSVNGKVITPPPYSHSYRLTSELQQKDEYVWSGWKIGNAEILKDQSVYRMAKQFANDISAGLVKVAPPDHDTDAAPTTGAQQFDETNAF